MSFVGTVLPLCNLWFVMPFVCTIDATFVNFWPSVRGVRDEFGVRRRSYGSSFPKYMNIFGNLVGPNNFLCDIFSIFIKAGDGRVF